MLDSTTVHIMRRKCKIFKAFGTGIGTRKFITSQGNPLRLTLSQLALRIAKQGDEFQDLGWFAARLLPSRHSLLTLAVSIAN
jgi:hypothetical protein